MKFISKFDRYITVFYFVTIITVVLTSYYTFKDVINTYNKNQYQAILPMFSIVSSELIRPLNVAYFMANDPLLIEFVERPDLSEASIIQYLQRLSNKYEMLTFIALEKHAISIDSKKLVLPLSHPDLAWYHKLKNIDKDQTVGIGTPEHPQLFFDIKLFNDKDQFIGFVGVGIDLKHFAEKFTEYRQRFGFEVVFADQSNDVTLSTDQLMNNEMLNQQTKKINISQLDWYQDLLSKAKNEQLSNAVITIDDSQRMISQMPIHALNWRMFVISPPASQQSEYWQLFLTRISIFSLIIIVLYFVFSTIVDYFKKRLVEDTEIDHLTRLPNRSYLNWKFEEMACHHTSLCLAMADIDDFKLVNDTYGHQIGDNVLKGIAEQFTHNLRHQDISVRWGGEEFILILPDTSIEQAVEIIERIKASVAAKAFKLKDCNETFHTTISFGLSQSDENDKTLNQLIAQADKALYQAKHNGKNRIEVFNEHQQD